MPNKLTEEDRQRILIAGVYHMRVAKLRTDPAWTVKKLVEAVHRELPEYTPRQLRAVYDELLAKTLPKLKAKA